jgi:hypothetical protein
MGAQIQATPQKSSPELQTTEVRKFLAVMQESGARAHLSSGFEIAGSIDQAKADHLPCK